MSDTTTIFEEEPDLDTFGGRLSRALDVSDLNTRELAWRLGVKTATVQEWETDRSQPGSHRLGKLSGLLNVSLSWLLHGVGTAPAEHPERYETTLICEQLAKLKLLHAQTGQLIGSIEQRLDAVGVAAPRPQ